MPMPDGVELGCTPHGEDCEQVGTPNYSAAMARAECRALINQLKRENPALPEGVWFRVRGRPHDFGTYYEAEACYDTEAGGEAAWALEGRVPEKWDNEALAELEAARRGIGVSV